MRLLTVQEKSRLSILPGKTMEFGLETFYGEPPPYAILSHTWGEDSEEITYQDILDNKSAIKAKSGYKKLVYCAKQAARDNLKYFWVDTCCIDKSSSAELSEAINSMFTWYQQAQKCYVYLTDIIGLYTPPLE